MIVARGAWRYIFLIALVAVTTLLVAPTVGLIVVGLLGFTLWFFRDPDRTPHPTGILAPADGKITVIRHEDGRLRVGVFMNVFNVHVNRAPLDGTVTNTTHRAGSHRPAFSKDSDRNERVTIDLESARIILIAGWFARRITPYVSEGDTIARGDRIGHIAFGSRVDVCLPPEIAKTDLTIERGDRVKAGETVIANQP